MKTNILLVAIALIVTACASHREVSSFSHESDHTESHHAQLMDTAASARGNSVH